MQQENFVIFMEEMTKKMSQTFKSLHQMCEQQLQSMRKSTIQTKAQPSLPQSHLLAMIQKQHLAQQIMRKSSHTQNGHSKKGQKNGLKQIQIEQTPKKQKKLKKIQNEIQNQNESQAQDSKQQLKKLKKKQKQQQKQREKLLKSAEKQKKQQKPSKKMKPVSHKPKAPTSSFLLFFKQQQQIIAKNYPNYGVVQLTKVAALCWNNLSVQQKQPYQKLFQIQRKKYQEQMQIYRKQFPEEIKQKQMRKKQKKSKTKSSKQTSSHHKQNSEKGGNNQKQQQHSNNHKHKNYLYETPGPSQINVKIENNMIQENDIQENYNNNQNIKIEEQISNQDEESESQQDEDAQNSLGDII